MAAAWPTNHNPYVYPTRFTRACLLAFLTLPLYVSIIQMKGQLRADILRATDFDEDEDEAEGALTLPLTPNPNTLTPYLTPYPYPYPIPAPTPIPNP